MNRIFTEKLLDKHIHTEHYPSSFSVTKFTNNVLQILFPALSKSRKKFRTLEDIDRGLEELRTELTSILSKTPSTAERSGALATTFFDRLPEVYELLQTDIETIVKEDPAAVSEYEVIRAYPGFYAIAFYRLAHLLHQLDIPLLPRILTEYAHSRTGIDIHPAASIGPYFFIDHGTGIVIGATCHIGKYVKVYQGVTLGALSVSKELSETKRHPTIEDNVVIYSGATILGGDTIIGQGSIIGGNVWLTKSIPAYSVVYHIAEIDLRRAQDKAAFIKK